MKNADVDNGYAWIILICSSFVYLIIAGSLNTFGILYTELLDYYGDGAGSTAWISSICTFFALGLGPFVNFLGEKYTYRLVMMIGSCLVLLGYTTSAFVRGIKMFYLTHGVITGFGFGLMLSPCSTVVNFYFKKKRSFANGIMVSFSGVGGFSFPYMYRWLIDKYGLHGAFLLSGALLFHSCVAVALLLQPQQIVEKHQTTNRKIISWIIYLWEAKQRMFKVGLFKIPKYTICFTALCFQFGNFTGNLIALPGQVRSLDLGKQAIVQVLSVYGATEIVSRTFLGWFAGLNIIKRTNLLLMSSFVSSLIAFGIPHLPYKGALLVYAVLMGCFSSTFWSLVGVLLVDCVGLDNLSPAIGLLLFAMGIMICVSQPVTGWLEDSTGSWDMSFRFIGVLSAISCMCLLLGPMIERMSCFQKERKSNLSNIEKQMEEYNGGAIHMEETEDLVIKDCCSKSNDKEVTKQTEEVHPLYPQKNDP
ncbi:monocarboxylate transporter 12-like isoform X1 [Mytilus californianus]|uniref:monocarboxylate transporter 12-like isoform X1 n=1 Tax=Mytilus californianus TaxID=6549 RepID=UPI002245E6D1|nr:monocarboxylate transporter 12-like isoform X1 [Mytilus californianus]